MDAINLTREIIDTLPAVKKSYIPIDSTANSFSLYKDYYIKIYSSDNTDALQKKQKEITALFNQ